MTRLIVAAVALIAGLAAADTVRQALADEPRRPEPRRPEARITRWRIDRGPTPCRSRVPGACGRYLVLDGGVTRDGRSYLGRLALTAAFPGAPVGRVEAFRVADAHDGTLAVAVHDAVGRGAVQVWRGQSPLGAFRVPARSFAAGLGWTPAGDLIAAYPRRGRPILYDRRGTRVGEVRWARRPG